ncbi:DUF1931 family protein [Rhodococcus opacus]|nr:DUF1931 family protein [Rhodococcus opacus]RZL83499.1 MAG: DUF1931 family protein [Rhodococcus sp. (in: high G+C Gram-positive bacteria)]
MDAAESVRVMTFDQFQDIFRVVASVGVGGDDFRPFDDIVTGKLYDLLLVAQQGAAAQHRYIIEFTDLPITKGLQENIDLFRELGPRLRVEPILARLATYPPLDRILATETQARLPEITGGLSATLARTFRTVYPDVRFLRSHGRHWSTISALVDLYL